jgi:hypothetical protein
MSVMPDSWVTSVTITDTAQLKLSVQLDGFKPGRNVEISGQVTQSGGAFANFYDIQPVPAEPNAADLNNPSVLTHYSVDVLTNPLPPHKFRDDQDVTVVLRVSKVWLTVLGAHKEPAEGTGLQDSGQPAPGGTAWDRQTQYSDLDGNSTDGKSGPPDW